MTKITYCSNKSCSNFKKSLPTSKLVCPICGHSVEKQLIDNSSETQISLDGNSTNKKQIKSFSEDACPVCGAINCSEDPRRHFRDASENRRDRVRRATSISLILFLVIVALSYFNKKEEVHRNVTSIPSSEIGRNLPQELRRQIQKQIRGFLTIDIPLEMKVQEESFGKICITQTKHLPCDKSLKNNSPIENIRTSSLARVVLKGNKFDIYALNNEEQAITDLSTSEWNWRITSLQPGKQILTVRISLWLISIHENKEVYQDLELKNLNIDVRRNLNYEFKKFLVTHGIRIILTSVIFLALITLVKLFLKKKYLLTKTTQDLLILINDFIQGIKKMANDPKHQTFHFGTVNSSVINAGGTVDTQKYEQNNYMAQDLAQAASQIQNLLEQLQQQGMTVDLAQKQVAQDIVNQANNDPQIKEALIKWSKSVGNATITDVVKGVVKLAIRSAGIPLP